MVALSLLPNPALKTDVVFGMVILPLTVSLTPSLTVNVPFTVINDVMRSALTTKLPSITKFALIMAPVLFVAAFPDMMVIVFVDDIEVGADAAETHTEPFHVCQLFFDDKSTDPLER